MRKVTKKTGTGKSVRTRTVSVLLILLIAAVITLTLASGVQFSNRQVQGTEYEKAADYLQENDPYINSRRLNRMGCVVRSYFRPHDSEGYSVSASVALANGDYTKAIAELENSIELFEGEKQKLGDLYIKSGCLWALRNDWQKAAEALQTGVELDPENGSGWLILAEAHLQNGEQEQALECMKTCAEVSPPDSSQYLAIAEMELSLGRYAEAVESCANALKLKGPEEADKTEVLELQTEAYDRMRTLGKNQWEQGLYEEAEKNFSVYLAYDDTAKELFYLRALCRQNLENYTGAIEDFTEAMKQEDYADECLYNRALCYIQTEDAAAAADDFRQIIERDADPKIVQMTYKLLGLTV